MRDLVNKMAWRVLEARNAYYYPDDVHPSWCLSYSLTDAEYDKLEREYVSLCAALGIEPTASLGIELDKGRESVKLVRRKMVERRSRNSYMRRTYEELLTGG